MSEVPQGVPMLVQQRGRFEFDELLHRLRFPALHRYIPLPLIDRDGRSIQAMQRERAYLYARALGGRFVTFRERLPDMVEHPIHGPRPKAGRWRAVWWNGRQRGTRIPGTGLETADGRFVVGADGEWIPCL